MKKILTCLITAVILTSLTSDLKARNFGITRNPPTWKIVRKTVGDSTNTGGYDLWYPEQLEYLRIPTQATLDQIFTEFSKLVSGFRWQPQGTKADTTIKPEQDINYPYGYVKLQPLFTSEPDTIITQPDTAVVKTWYPKAIIVLYASDQTFRQQKILPGMITYGISGFFEHNGFRIAIPYDGSFAAFQSTLHHEMTHSIVNQLMRESLDRFNGTKNPLKKIRRQREKDKRLELPLWFAEGTAELLTQKYHQTHKTVMWDEFVRHETTNRRKSIPALDQMVGLENYTLALKFMRWVADTYGFEKIIEFIIQRPHYEEFDKAWENVFGQTYEEMWLETEIDEKFYAYFEPFFTDSLRSVTEKVTWPQKQDDKNKEEEDVKAEQPTITGYASYDASKIAYYTLDPKWDRRVEVTDLFTADVWIVNQMFKNKTLWYRWDSPPDLRGNKVALVVNREGQDELHIYKLEKDEKKGLFSKRRKTKPKITTVVTQINTLRQKNMLSIKTPALNNKGTKIVFEGISPNGFSDIYLWDTTIDTVIRLTNDHYYDFNPRFAYDGKHEQIVFISDRLDAKKFGLFMLIPEKKSIIYLYQPEKNDVFIDQIAVSPYDQSIAFRTVSLEHSPQIFLYNQGHIYHIFSTFKGIYQIVGWIDNKTLLLLDTRGKFVKFTLDDLESYTRFEVPHINMANVATWEPDQPDTIITPVEPVVTDREWKQKYTIPLPLSRSSLILSTPPGEEILIFGFPSVMVDITQVAARSYTNIYGQAYLTKLDLRKRLQKQYTLAFHSNRSWRYTPAYQNVRPIMDKTIQFHSSFYWPFNLEDGAGFGFSAGWLQRDYLRYLYSPYQYLSGSQSYQGWRPIVIKTYGTGGPTLSNHIYAIHDAVFPNYFGEPMHGSWLITQFNWMLLKNRIQEGQFLVDGRYYIQLIIPGIVLANRAYLIKSFGVDRALNMFDNAILRSSLYPYIFGTDIAQLQTELRFPIFNFVAFQPSIAPESIFGFRVNGSVFFYTGNIWFGDQEIGLSKRAGFAIKIAIFPGFNIQYEKYKIQYKDWPWSRWQSGWFLSADF
ncbi:hypothetical protein MYX07_02280 [Patescibacteria group bacterium AH-259-L07]|nr:hypothetical protein [Patescibacteria group bacterium AH-259-L07]